MLFRSRVLFAGVLRETATADSNDSQSEAGIKRTPLLMTTSRGNSWKVSSPYELMMMNPSRLMSNFYDGHEPVVMGYLVTGRLKSSFPDGIEIKVKDKSPAMQTSRTNSKTEQGG